MAKTQYDPKKPLWSIMTKSHGGTVSVIRDLTLEECAKIYERLDPCYGVTSRSFSVHKDFLKGSMWSSTSGGYAHSVDDGDIDIREVFGPDGWDGFQRGQVQSWPKFITIYTDDKGSILPDEYQENVDAARREITMRKIAKDFKQND